jgi:hypothetical protein
MSIFKPLIYISVDIECDGVDYIHNSCTILGVAVGTDKDDIKQ